MRQIEIRDYQQRIHTQLMDFINKPQNTICKTALIQAPTGSGKTICALRAAKALTEQGHKVGWIAHRRELLHQAIYSNFEYSDFQIQNIEFISLFDRNPEHYRNISAIILDECQHDATRSAAILYENIKPQIIIGLSATPYRVDKAKLCFSKVITDAGIRQLIMEGWLSPYKQWLIEEAWTPENVARLYLESPDQWGKSVMYFLLSSQAEECAQILRANGITAEAILGDSPRKTILQDFRSGKLQVLTNVLVLTEGFDCSELQTVFVRPSSKAPAIQMCGRVFRKHPGKEFANIVQSIDTQYPFTRHARALEQWVRKSGQWLSIDAKNLGPIIAEQRKKLAQAEPTEMPAYIKKNCYGKLSVLEQPHGILHRRSPNNHGPFGGHNWRR